MQLIFFESLILVRLLESCFSAGIVKKLFQCAAKSSDSVAIDDRVDPAGQEHA